MPAAERNENQGIVFNVIMGAVILACDQFSKWAADKRLFPEESIPVIKNVFHITLVHNSGTAFGLFKDKALLFIFISLAAIGYIIALFCQKKTVALRRHWLSDTALAMILSGAVGNLIDRIRCGFVIDMLDFRVWPVFNIADSAITLGTGLLIWGLFRRER